MPTKKKPDLSNDFIPLKDAKAVTRAFELGLKNKAMFTLWLKNQTLKFETYIFDFVPMWKQLSFQFPVTINEQKFKKAVEASGSQEIFASAQISGEQIFFKSILKPSSEDKAILIEIPKEVFKIQRRSAIRVPIKSPVKVPVQFNTPALKGAFTALDLSVNGIGIGVTKEQAESFPKGTKLESIEIKIKSVAYTTRGVVRHTKELPATKTNPSLVKIGIEFDKLPAALEQVLVQFVLEESRKMFGNLF